MQDFSRSEAVIVELDQQCGQLRLDRDSGRLLGVDLTPDALTGLEALAAARCRIVLLVPADLGPDDLRDLERLVPGASLAICRDRESADAIARCCRQLDLAPEQTVFVGADRTRRASAVRQGARALPHVLLAAWQAEGQRLYFVSFQGPRSAFDRLSRTLPYAFDPDAGGTWTLIAAAAHADVVRASAMGLSVSILDLDLATEEPLRIHLDAAVPKELETLERLCVIAAQRRSLLVARGRSESSDRIRIHGRHGHQELLTPQPQRLRRPPSDAHRLAVARLDLSRFCSDETKIQVLSSLPGTWPFPPICPSASQIASDVDRYRGAAPLDASGSITSRHSQHPDNARAVDALLADLHGMGYCAYTHSFEYGGRTLHNVIADLPGVGYFILDPDIIARIRETLLELPMPWPPDPWIRRVERFVGEKWLGAFRELHPDPLVLRRSLEELLGLRAYLPWWWLRCPIAGYGARIVVVGCHLDSTAGFDPSYDPAADAAPGADDDASGIAGVLAVARSLAAWKGRLRHTLRFCFFNAEESGLVGSKAYAAWMKSCDAPIKAAVCMDMIGFNSDEDRTFEVHAGYGDPDVRDASVPYAETLADWAATLGALGTAQLYKGTSWSGAPDRDVYDGAINRSDHAAFQQQGYPAVLVSEDFFANLPTEPAADPNPHYHRSSDQVVDPDYAADVICAVTRAIQEIAS